MLRRTALFTALAFLSAMAIEVPGLINYQGKLTNAAGQPQQGTFNFVFKIYDAETGGTEYWSETQSVTTDELGLFNVLLGSVSPPVVLPEGPDCYLEITVEGNAISPRQRIVSNGYSYYAQTAEDANKLGGTPAADYVVRPVQNADIADDAVTTEKIQDGTIQPGDLAFTPVTRPITPPVSTAEIADDAVTSAKILDGTITTADLAFTPATRPLSPGVATTEIQDGAVTTAKIAADAVTNRATYRYGPIYTSYSWSYTTWYTPFTFQVTITTTGGPVLILVSTGGWSTTYGIYGVGLNIGLFRNGSQIFTNAGFAPYYYYYGTSEISLVYLDTPAAGTYTYDVRFRPTYPVTVTYYQNYAGTSYSFGTHSIIAIELKR